MLVITICLSSDEFHLHAPSRGRVYEYLFGKCCLPKHHINVIVNLPKVSMATRERRVSKKKTANITGHDVITMLSEQ